MWQQMTARRQNIQGAENDNAIKRQKLHMLYAHAYNTAESPVS